MEDQSGQNQANEQVKGSDALDLSRVWRWQVRLLPFMVGAISLLAIFFFVSSLIQIEKLHRSVALEDQTEVSTVLANLDADAAKISPDARIELLKWKARATLEADVVKRRYQQVRSTLQLRAWTRHMGFMTGMIMAFVGAIFIMSKLKEQETNLTGEYQAVKWGLATSSPGIVLATLGTALMFVTIVVDYTFDTRDVAVYLESSVPGEAILGRPTQLADPGSDAADKKLFPPLEGDGNATKVDPGSN